MQDLISLGWGPFFEQQTTEKERTGTTIARIVEPSRGLSRARHATGEVWAEYLLPPGERSGPAVGDWVIGRLRDHDRERRLSIERILNRKNKLGRSAPGSKGYEQILCANVDVAFVVIAATQNLNKNAVDRYLEIVRENEILPVVVVTKADDPTTGAELAAAIEKLTAGAKVFSVSVHQNRGLDHLGPYFIPGNTVVLLGASGSGKSTLVNHLVGTSAQKISDVRETDQKGRHTTTGRRLLSLPSGAMVIDSPGIREIQRWEAPIEKVNKKPKIKKQNRSSWKRDLGEE